MIPVHSHTLTQHCFVKIVVLLNRGCMQAMPLFFYGKSQSAVTIAVVIFSKTQSQSCVCFCFISILHTSKCCFLKDFVLLWLVFGCVTSLAYLFIYLF